MGANYARWILGGMIKRWLSKEKTPDDDRYVYIATVAVSQFGDWVYASVQNTRFLTAYTVSRTKNGAYLETR